MGCDIHIYSEVRVKTWNSGGMVGYKWKPADPWGLVPEQYMSIKEITDPDNSSETLYALEYLSVPSQFRVYDGRNYHLFSVLNGVRNSDEIPSFFEDKEIPEDITEWNRKHGNPGSLDHHSHCWATLREFRIMREWMKTKTVDAWGVINKHEMPGLEKEGYEFKATGPNEYTSNKPLTSYARGMMGPNIVATTVHWSIPLVDYAGKAIDHIISQLEMRKKAFGAETDDDVRALWWYDN